MRTDKECGGLLGLVGLRIERIIEGEKQLGIDFKDGKGVSGHLVISYAQLQAWLDSLKEGENVKTKAPPQYFARASSAYDLYTKICDHHARFPYSMEAYPYANDPKDRKRLPNTSGAKCARKRL